MYDPKEIIDLIAGNLEKTRNPFGVPNFILNRWGRTAYLPRFGDSMLFTGMMYQSLPYIERTTKILEKYEDTRAADYIGYGRYAPKSLAGLGLACMTSAKDRKRARRILNNIVRILQKSGVSFCYKPEIDFYSGVLLYDLGDLDGFVKHARFVANRLIEKGVRKLITVDPHTTYALKELYPKYTGETFEVKTYFECVRHNGHSENGNSAHRQVTIHDPCFYGRYLKVSDQPVKILEDLGFDCVEPRNKGNFTFCCGGPAESVSPKLNREILNRRVEELRSTGAPIVAMCPICLGNLTKAGAHPEDFATLLARSI